MMRLRILAFVSALLAGSLPSPERYLTRRRPAWPTRSVRSSLRLDRAPPATSALRACSLKSCRSLEPTRGGRKPARAGDSIYCGSRGERE